MRAALYVRISRDREGAGLGVERQEQDCRELADRIGWEVVDVYTDNDLSAYSGKPRPAYRQMLEDIRTGKVEAVVAWHSDRLHRQVVELEEFVRICEAHGTAVQTVRSGEIDLTTATGLWIARMLGSAAQHEIDHARERMKRAKAQAAADGRWRGGRRPFGYEADGVTVRPSEAVPLLEATRGLVAGRSLNALARDMNDAGITTAEGKAIDGTNLRRLIQRPRNAGLIDQRGEIVGTASWEPIVPEDIWRAALSVLADPSRKTTTGPERRWLGSGLYLCGVCGSTLYVSLSNGGARSYRCPNRAHVTRDQPAVDAFVLEIVAGVLSRPDLATLLHAPDDGTTDALRGQQEVLRARLASFEADYAEGLITGRQMADATARVNAELDTLGAKAAAQMRNTALGELADEASPGKAFLTANLERQRAIVDALATVTIHPGRRGRPAGWQPGQGYADLDAVDVAPKI
ncbi:recombinase family protein [Oerskovia paurometabola]|uniref:recombinase family protein n=1 Tax=Oerskovia paurometabola TaxID=162170 RepID=UPI0037F48B49